MKTPTARKLPSGSWYCRVRVGGEDVSITAPTEKAGIKPSSTSSCTLSGVMALAALMDIRATTSFMMLRLAFISVFIIFSKSR